MDYFAHNVYFFNYFILLFLYIEWQKELFYAKIKIYAKYKNANKSLIIPKIFSTSEKVNFSIYILIKNFLFSLMSAICPLSLELFL